MADEPAGTIGSGVFEGSVEDLERRERAEAHIYRLRAAGFEQLDWASLEVVDGLLVDLKGRAWQRALGELPDGRDKERESFVVGDDLAPVWLRRPERGPTTRGEIEQQQERTQRKAAEQARAEEQRRAELAKTATHVISYGDLEPMAPPSLKAAADTIVRQGGRLELDRDRLYIVGPFFDEAMRAAARMLYAAEEVVVDHLRRKAELPDLEITGAGALVGRPKGRGG